MFLLSIFTGQHEVAWCSCKKEHVFPDKDVASGFSAWMSNYEHCRTLISCLIIVVSINSFLGCIHIRKVWYFICFGPDKYIYFFCCLVGAVRFHTALFASEPEIVNKTTCVLRSSIHWTEILKQGKQEVQKQANHTFVMQFWCNWCDDVITTCRK